MQFVVITLIAEMPIVRDAERAGSAFSTPTIVYFSTVLLLAGIVSAPWDDVAPVAILWGILGLGGVGYAGVVTRRLRIQKAYKLIFYDWVFHVILPFAAFITLAASAYATYFHVRAALFAVAAASLLLLFVGIHNAWDAVTYHVFVKKSKKE